MDLEYKYLGMGFLFWACGGTVDCVGYLIDAPMTGAFSGTLFLVGIGFFALAIIGEDNAKK